MNVPTSSSLFSVLGSLGSPAAKPASAPPPQPSPAQPPAPQPTRAAAAATQPAAPAATPLANLPRGSLLNITV